MAKVGDIVVVHWIDAACEDGANASEAVDYECPPVKTYGEVLNVNASRIVLGTHLNRPLGVHDLPTDDGEQVWYIPVGMIEKVEVLRHADSTDAPA